MTFSFRKARSDHFLRDILDLDPSFLENQSSTRNPDPPVYLLRHGVLVFELDLAGELLGQFQFVGGWTLLPWLCSIRS